MPIYEYRCEACGARIEALQKMSAPPLLDCERCGAQNTLQKLLSAHVVGRTRGPSRRAAEPGCGQCAQNPTCPMAQ